MGAWAPLAPTEQISSSHTTSDRSQRRGSSTTAATITTTAATPLPGGQLGVMHHGPQHLGLVLSFPQYIAQVGTTRQLLLQRMGPKGDSNPHGPMRPTILADTPDDPRSGLRAPERQWEAAQGGGAAAASTSAPQPAARKRGAPDASTDAPWMHPAHVIRDGLVVGLCSTPCLWAPVCGPSRVTFTASADMLGAYLTSPASRTSCAACPSARRDTRWGTQRRMFGWQEM